MRRLPGILESALAALAFLASAASAGAQQLPPGFDPKAFEGLDPKAIDDAVAEGVKSLVRLKQKKGDPKTDELFLLTLMHAGVPRDDADFQEVFRRMLDTRLEDTYNAALRAMVLREADPAAHQGEIYVCAQFLADNQARNGQWSYGKPVLPVRKPAATPPSGSGASLALKRLRVAPRPLPGGAPGTDGGDFSNTQYAALGIRACTEASVEFPKDLLLKARAAWEKGQEEPPPGATGTAAPRGWGYGMNASPTGSMTAGGVGAMAIYDHLLGIDSKQDPSVLAGLAWLEKHFTVTANPRRQGEYYHHYYLYGLERAGILSGTEKIGSHYWYREGVQVLLATRDSGTWADHDEQGSSGWTKQLRDTCFAILFLRRATRPLEDVASVDIPKK